jgi:hypothetical protein
LTISTVFGYDHLATRRHVFAVAARPDVDSIAGEPFVFGW